MENQTEIKLSAPVIGIHRLRMSTDGQGVTTLVGLWGCPLRCRYCLNPHSWQDDVEKYKRFTPQELLEIVYIDNLYFLSTDGGVTFGGGEPLLHPDFIQAFGSLCPPQWRITLETSLNVPLHNIEKVVSRINHFIVDMKDTNNEIYHQYTSASNQRVFDNLKWLVDKVGADIITVRLPLISQHNTQKDVEQSKKILGEMGIQNFDVFEYYEDVEQFKNVKTP